MPFLIYGLSIFIVSRVSDVLIDSATQTYWEVSKYILPLTVVVALARIFYNQITLGSYGDLKSVLKDSIKFIVIIAFTPIVFTFSIKKADEIALKITESYQTPGFMNQAKNQISYPSQINKVDQKLDNDSNKSSSSISLLIDFAELFRVIVNGLSTFIANALNYLRNIALITLFAAAPIFIFLGLMLRMKFFSNLVLSLGATLLIWPILASILSKFSNTVFQADSNLLASSFSQCSLLLMFSLMQLMIPVLSMGSALRAASQIGSSAASIGQLAGGAAMSVTSGISSSVSQKITQKPATSNESAFKHV